MNDCMISVEKIVFHRKDRLILDDVSLSVRSVTIVGMLGPNGAGKTTLFDVICGLRLHEEGSVSGLISLDRIAYLTQVVTVPDALKLGEMAQLIYGLSMADEERVKDMLRDVEAKISDKFQMLWNRRANSCSYGEKRWFVLMIILSLDADLYILDEPTAGVDLEYRFYIWQAISRVKSQGKAILFSTHIMNEVERHCDCFYFLHEGSARRFDTAIQLMEECKTDSLEEAFVKYVTR